jgi:hypothetical protein
MTPAPDPRAPDPEEPAGSDLLTIGLLVFFVAILGIVAALLALPMILA